MYSVTGVSQSIRRDLNLKINDLSVLKHRKARRLMNFGRVLEHESLHNLTRQRDSEKDPDMGSPIHQMANFPSPIETKVNEFRVGMGLNDYQRIIYGIKKRGRWWF